MAVYGLVRRLLNLRFTSSSRLCAEMCHHYHNWGLRNGFKGVSGKPPTNRSNRLFMALSSPATYRSPHSPGSVRRQPRRRDSGLRHGVGDREQVWMARL